ncbi:3-isopropylmalate dehydratase small subunit [Allohahella marinimesophila]|uniref:3-isopropylmalate dehydratase small subunit n=1 Tax=Allohahella marinimesophila TaxID=1054972 RepID=A0ABP7NVZ5_9GAMM
MRKFTVHTGIVAPLDRANIDTDMIIPKQFLKSIKRSGFGPNLFDELRYLDEGQPDADNSSRPLNPDFVLNNSPYDQASVLLAGPNFGCGSSREHAPWALEDFGFRSIIAPGFADIFFNNCFKNGLLPIVLKEEEVRQIFAAVAKLPGCEVKIDLQAQTVTVLNGEAAQPTFTFEVDGFRKKCLLEGLDEIGLTLKEGDAIRAYELRRKQATPWMFTDIENAGA